MQPHRKNYIKPGNPLFANPNNSDASISPKNHMSETERLDALQGAAQDKTTTTGIAQSTKQVTPITDPRLHHPFYAELLSSQNANGETTAPGVSQHNNFILPVILEGNTKVTPTPEKSPESAQIFDDTATSLEDIIKGPHALGTMLAVTYHTTTSEEIKQIIACLVNLDVMITRQTHLNELHEAHTAKNFREQRHLNKDRKLRHSTIVKSIDHKLAGLDAQRMAQQTMIKQHDIRATSHQVQLKGLNEKTQMLAQAGEWMETTVGETQQELTDLQREVGGLKIENINLRDEVRGLKEEVRRFKEKEEVWEARLSALEQVTDGKVQLAGVRVKQQQVLNAASFAVGNGRVFPFSY